MVLPGGEADFLAPLPVGRLWGVGPKTEARLAELGVHNCGDLARVAADTLTANFGTAQGQSLYAHARGIDLDPIVTQRDLKQISQETTFSRDVTDRARLWSTLRDLAYGVGERLQAHGFLARTITLKLRYANFQSLTRSSSLPVPTDDPEAIAQVAASLVRTTWDRSRPIRLIGVGATRLVPKESWLQLPLPGVLGTEHKLITF